MEVGIKHSLQLAWKLHDAKKKRTRKQFAMRGLASLTRLFFHSLCQSYLLFWSLALFYVRPSLTARMLEYTKCNVHLRLYICLYTKYVCYRVTTSFPSPFCWLQYGQKKSLTSWCQIYIKFHKFKFRKQYSVITIEDRIRTRDCQSKLSNVQGGISVNFFPIFHFFPVKYNCTITSKKSINKF